MSVYSSKYLLKMKDFQLQFTYFGNFYTEKDMMVI